MNAERIQSLKPAMSASSDLIDLSSVQDVTYDVPAASPRRKSINAIMAAKFVPLEDDDVSVYSFSGSSSEDDDSETSSSSSSTISSSISDDLPLGTCPYFVCHSIYSADEDFSYFPMKLGGNLDPYPEYHMILKDLSERCATTKSRRCATPLLTTHVVYCVAAAIFLIMVYVIVYTCASYPTKDRSQYCSLVVVTLVQMLFIYQPCLIVLLAIRAKNAENYKETEGQKHFSTIQAAELSAGLQSVAGGVTPSCRHAGIDSETVFHPQIVSSNIINKQEIRKTRQKNHTAPTAGIASYIAIIFVSVVLLSLNIQVGYITRRFKQTKYVEKFLNIGEARTVLDVRSRRKLAREEAIFGHSSGKNTNRGDIDIQAHTLDEFWRGISSIYNNLRNAPLNVRINNNLVVLSHSLRLTQHRTTEDFCNEFYSNQSFARCSGDFWNYKTDARSYKGSWASPASTAKPASLGSHVHGRYRNDRFVYVEPLVNTDLPLLSSDILTTTATYPGGGYQVYIPMGSNESAMIDFLNRSSWVDNKTKLVTVDFFLYNPDNGIATSVFVTYEFNGIGIFQEARLFSFHFIDKDDIESTSVLLVSLFAMLEIFFFFKNIFLIRTEGFYNFTKHVTNTFNIIQHPLTVVTIGLQVMSKLLKSQMLTEWSEINYAKQQLHTFVDFSSLGSVSFYQTAIMCWPIIFKLMDFMAAAQIIPQFDSFVNVCQETTDLVFLPVFSFIFINIFGSLIFITQVYIFSGWFGSALVLLDPSHYRKPMLEFSRIWSEVYIVFMGLFMMRIGVINLFVCFINGCIATHKKKQSKNPSDLTQILNQTLKSKATHSSADIYSIPKGNKKKHMTDMEIFGPYK